MGGGGGGGGGLGLAGGIKKTILGGEGKYNKIEFCAEKGLD